MGLNEILGYFARYGSIFVFVVVFLEYLNVPGLAATFLMPAIGICSARSNINLVPVILFSVLGGMLASWILYFLGVFCGDTIIARYLKKHPKQKEYLEKKMVYVREKGNVGVFISRFVPAVRTLISIPAGLVRLNFVRFSAFSIVAITIYNSALILAGYFMGESAIRMFS